MQNQQKGVLVLAVAMGFVAIMLVQTYASRVKQESEIAKGEMSIVLTVTQDVKEGTPLTEDLLREMQVPKKWRNPYALGPQDRETILGQRPVIPVYKDQQLTQTDFGRSRDGDKLSDALKPGERAITIPVNQNSGLSGLLQPNDHVDILATFQVPSEVESGFEGSEKRSDVAKKLGMDIPRYALKTVTVTLLQNVTILATGRITGNEDPQALQAKESRDRNAPRYQNVTVAVTPKEAEILAYTIKKGDLTLALRSPQDLEILDDPGKIVFTDIVAPDVRKKLQAEHNRIQQKRREAAVLPEVFYGKGGKKNP